MKITNINALPEPLVRAVSKQREYQPDEISVTGLVLPPQIRTLSIRHDNEITEDASDRIFALLGTLLHYVLAGHTDTEQGELSEVELETQVLGWRVVGHYDLTESCLELVGDTLTDWKLTSVYAMKDKRLKPEWVAQLNCYAELLRLKDKAISKAQIVAIGRDWSRMKSFREADYPKEQVIKREVPLWSREKVSQYIQERVRLHQLAEAGTWDDCTAEERWAKPDQWALMKRGQKRAVKLFESEHAAEWARAKNQYILLRPGESTRCEYYCPVAKFCKQYAAIQAAKTQDNPTQEKENT